MKFLMIFLILFFVSCGEEIKCIEYEPDFNARTCNNLDYMVFNEVVNQCVLKSCHQTEKIPGEDQRKFEEIFNDQYDCNIWYDGDYFGQIVTSCPASGVYPNLDYNIMIQDRIDNNNLCFQGCRINAWNNRLYCETNEDFWVDHN